MELEIKAELMAWREGIKQHDAQAVSSATVRLDDLLSRFRAALHPRLAGFLEDHEYERALEWIDRDARDLC